MPASSASALTSRCSSYISKHAGRRFALSVASALYQADLLMAWIESLENGESDRKSKASKMWRMSSVGSLSSVPRLGVLPWETLVKGSADGIWPYPAAPCRV
ncbi:hypothetical protein N658DRAFT_220352 [Parathielavia hyrcaniae]|uniref:Uncharacterized protein n=1 Tax=Parathielavia hyrcaniae TaxID=113614 RepID=A0AAN6Q018_9PEZI|nr:hypothetical protein N658DRAFT_220352 [Parathielavia hyrcaniae]